VSAVGRVVVVGLGPAGADLVVPAARAALASATRRFVRTTRHPAVADLAREGLTFESFDDVYDAAGDLDEVYAEIVTRLVAAARAGVEVAYAVPGSPAVAERTVVALRDAGVGLAVVPGVSFADLAWARLGVDPLHGGRLVDAHAFDVEAAGCSGPVLVAQCDRPDVLSGVKLALLEQLPPDHPVTVLQRLGLADEAVVTVALADLDRSVVPDHLTSVFVDTGGAVVAGELARLHALARRLRAPGGCPWDAAQTHHSLRRHLLEEAYEAAHALDALPADAPNRADPVAPDAYGHVAEELGDLLFQVVIHSVLAEEAGGFTLADVARGIHDKLVVRHPHVFGDVRVRDADEVVTNWEQIKKAERGDRSLVEGAADGLPGVLAAQKLWRKAESIGLDPHPEARLAVDRVAAALAGPEGDERALGDALGALVALARVRGVDAEAALAGWARRFTRRFAAMEAQAAADGVDLAGAPGDVVRARWDAAADEQPPDERPAHEQPADERPAHEQEDR
jgi:tetrapyrrole methylase family protein/MazG family protein